jgi:hypothetical protein
MATNHSTGWREIDDQFSRNEHHRTDWFGRSVEEEHDRYLQRTRTQDTRKDDGLDRRHRFADTDDDTNNNWRAWSGRSFAYDERHRDPRVPHRDRIAHDESSRYAAGYEECHGHPSVRGVIDYDRQWASRTEPTDEREGDPDPGFIPRDEYGRRRI